MARSAQDTRPALTTRTVKALEYSLRELDAMRPILADQIEVGFRDRNDLDNLDLTIAYLSRLIAWKQRRANRQGNGKGAPRQNMPLEETRSRKNR